MAFNVSKCAPDQVKLRGIKERVVRGILNKPDQIIKHEDKTIYQSIISEADKRYLIRVFINQLKIPNLVITVYKTSKIEKYYESHL